MKKSLHHHTEDGCEILHYQKDGFYTPLKLWDVYHELAQDFATIHRNTIDSWVYHGLPSKHGLTGVNSPDSARPLLRPQKPGLIHHGRGRGICQKREKHVVVVVVVVVLVVLVVFYK